MNTEILLRIRTCPTTTSLSKHDSSHLRYKQLQRLYQFASYLRCITAHVALYLQCLYYQSPPFSNLMCEDLSHLICILLIASEVEHLSCLLAVRISSSLSSLIQLLIIFYWVVLTVLQKFLWSVPLSVT